MIDALHVSFKASVWRFLEDDEDIVELGIEIAGAKDVEIFLDKIKTISGKRVGIWNIEGMLYQKLSYYKFPFGSNVIKFKFRPLLKKIKF